jgi:hypothetical protein
LLLKTLKFSSFFEMIVEKESAIFNTEPRFYPVGFGKKIGGKQPLAVVICVALTTR